MPRKDDRKSQSTRNNNSSAHYERSNDNPNMQNIPDAPSFSDYGDLLKESIGADNEELFNARLKTYASGLPFIGPMVQAYDKAQQLEDLYNNTGKVPAYASISGIGYGGLGNLTGRAAAGAVNIAAGAHDLYEFYSGSPDSFRMSMNGMYQ